MSAIQGRSPFHLSERQEKCLSVALGIGQIVAVVGIITFVLVYNGTFGHDASAWLNDHVVSWIDTHRWESAAAATGVILGTGGFIAGSILIYNWMSRGGKTSDSTTSSRIPSPDAKMPMLAEKEKEKIIDEQQQKCRNQ